jgi:hypothetical protein
LTWLLRIVPASLPDQRTALAVALFSALVLSSCGATHSAAGGASKRSTQTQAQGVTADNLAYLEIARASGALRSGAAAASLGHVAHLEGRESMVSAARLLREIHPGDRGLVALRAAARSALRAALDARGDPGSQHAAALSAIAATERINAGLRRYADRHPSVQELIPD